MELLVKLKQAGLKRTAFGVETGDEQMIVKIDKHIDHDTIRQAFKNAKAAGIETIGFFIIGLPGDTRETMQKTIDFAIELDPMIANFSMMTPYPGTIVYEQVKRNGRFLVQDWEDYVFFDQKARYEMGDLTAELMEEMYRKAYRQFYWRPKYVMRAMSRKDFWLNFGRNARMAWRTVVPRKEKTRAAAGDRGRGLNRDSLKMLSSTTPKEITLNAHSQNRAHPTAPRWTLHGPRHQRAIHAHAAGLSRRSPDPGRDLGRDLMELPVDQLGPQDLVGISAKTVMIDRAKALAARDPAAGRHGRRGRHARHPGAG